MCAQSMRHLRACHHPASTQFALQPLVSSSKKVEKDVFFRIPKSPGSSAAGRGREPDGATHRRLMPQTARSHLRTWAVPRGCRLAVLSRTHARRSRILAVLHFEDLCGRALGGSRLIGSSLVSCPGLQLLTVVRLTLQNANRKTLRHFFISTAMAIRM